MAITAQNVIDRVAADTRLEMAAEHGRMLEYVDRIQQEMVRKNPDEFLLSVPKYFITEDEQADYWVGAAGSQPTGTVDTSLNLTDFDTVVEKSVIDRSNNTTLSRIRSRPIFGAYSQPSGQYKPGKPTSFYADNKDVANQISLYPPPDNGNTFQPVPEAPILSNTAGGGLALGFHYFAVTFVDGVGESTPSSPAKVHVSTGGILNVTVESPKRPFLGGATNVNWIGYRVYEGASSNTSTMKLASGGTISFGVDSVIGAEGTGAAPPTANTLEPMGGYLIEFRYNKTRARVTATGDTLKVTDAYLDVIVAGVNWLAFKYLKYDDEAVFWMQLYKDGLRQIVEDRNTQVQSNSFISPDQASQGGSFGNNWHEYFRG